MECFDKDCIRPSGTVQSHCARCHRMFTGVSAFDRHQTISEGGRLECHFPETRGLVKYVRNGLQVWGLKPMSEEVRARLRSGGHAQAA